MIVPFLRSSLINEFDLCQGKSWLTYGLGFRGAANRSALVGSIVHGVLELLALAKLNHQNSVDTFLHDSFGEWPVSFLMDNQLDVNSILQVVYDYYNEESPGILGEDDVFECFKLVNKALAFKGGLYDPRREYVVAAEFPFDIELSQDWASYTYDSPAGKVSGKLALKGTQDFLYKVDDSLVCLDYKTGKTTQNWATGKDKDERSLYHDPQLQLYYYALAKSFPDVASIIIDLYFVRLDKVFTVAFDRSYLPDIEQYLRGKWEEMAATQKPAFIDKTQNKWKCKFCHFALNNQQGTNKTICRHFQDELSVKGYDKVMEENCRYDLLRSYGAGGSGKDRK